MGNPFDRLERMASRTADRVNGTAFILTPKLRTENGRPIDDPDRDAVCGSAIFDYAPTDAGVELGNRSFNKVNDLRSLQTAREPLLSVDRKYFASQSDEPRQGDQVTFPDRGDLPNFDVVSVRRDGLSRMEIKLAKRGSADG